MVDRHVTENVRWLSLGDACRLLEVNQATLRKWADNGSLRVYRTPGGHRRFLREDVLGLTEQPTPATGSERRDDLEDSALRRIRRRLRQENVARQPWYQSVEEEGRIRMRLFGRRLLSLLVQEAPLRRRRQDALAESYMLGHEYGSAMVDRGVPLRDTIQAFTFFRTMVLDSTNPRSWSQILGLADQVLEGIAECYQKRMAYPGAKPLWPIIKEVDSYSDGPNRPETVELDSESLPPG